MSSLLTDIQASKPGSYIFMTAFGVNGEVMLDPTAPDPATTTLTNVFLAAIERQVNLRVLINENLYLHSGLSFCKPLNDKAGETVCAPETRHNKVQGSLHAKMWAFVNEEEIVSYVGSMVSTRNLGKKALRVEGGAKLLQRVER